MPGADLMVINRHLCIIVQDDKQVKGLPKCLAQMLCW